RRVVLATDRKGDRTGGKIEQVTVESQITYRQLILTGILQVHINFCPSRPGVASTDIQKGIKRSGRLGIQQRPPQSGLADLTKRYTPSRVASATESAFPIPGVEVGCN